MMKKRGNKNKEKKQRKGTYKRIEKGLKEGCVLEVE